MCACKELNSRVWNSCVYGVSIEMDGQIVAFVRKWTRSQQAGNAASMALQQFAAQDDERGTAACCGCVTLQLQT